jgi:micrococcal nuclease
MNRIIVLLLIGLLLLAGYLFCSDLDPRYHSKEEVRWQIPLGRSYDYSNVLVTRVVDGDTLVLENNERVRLIGIDTPEMHESYKLTRDAQRSGNDEAVIKQMGRQAYEFTKKLVEGKHVRLEFDVERYDKYKRILAYVYLKDGTFVNAEIVAQGYASLLTYPPNVKYADLFLRLYQEARKNQRGLWK